MSRIAVAAVSIAATLVVLAAAGLTVIYGGLYPVAATEAHGSVTGWALNTLQQRSVARRAEALSAPLPSDSATLEHGFIHYDAMCVACHGAPGIERGEFGQGMTPTPPDLAEAAAEWSDAELLHVTKHGIRLAGMPAFGPTHSDEELIGIVAFLREMQGMTPEAYAARVQALEAALEAGEAGHTHAPGTPAHEH